MHKLLVVVTLLAAAPVAFGAALAVPGGIAKPSGAAAAKAANPKLVLVGGMSGGSPGGMGGGNAGGMGGGSGSGGNAGGMGGGNAGGMGGGSGGMNGGGFGGSPLAGFGRPDADPTASSGQYYTYHCVTASGRCPFVAPAALRDNSLRSGADCSCPNGQSRGQVE
jgi:hypothetical protein